MQTKKQIYAQATNDVAKRFNAKIRNLEDTNKNLRERLAEERQLRISAQTELLELRDKLEQYEDWNRRLQEFMDISPEQRENLFAEMRAASVRGKRIDSLLTLVTQFL